MTSAVSVVDRLRAKETARRVAQAALATYVDVLLDSIARDVVEGRIPAPRGQVRR